MVRKHTSSSRRRGIVLLVVMSLLALFAALGLTFVFYADSESANSGIIKTGETAAKADVDPELLLAFFLGQLIYDVGDVSPGAAPISPEALNSFMRGHSLARNMYGYNLLSANPSTYPYTGVGKVGQTVFPPTAFPGKSATVPPPVGSYNAPPGFNFPVPNMTYYPADYVLFDPERTQTPARPNPSFGLGSYVGWNVPYTYPDHNNFYQGVMNADGEILSPSWWRYWDAFGTAGGGSFVFPNSPMDPANPSWQAWSINPITNAVTISPWLKYLTVRPHPSVNPFFPPPADGGGDVNVMGIGAGLKKANGGHFNNNAIWTDPGFPIMTSPDGRKYKPLFASFITSLAGKIDLNTAGNNQANGANGSNRGSVPWEINPALILQAAGEYPNLFVGANGVPGRYGLGAGSVPGTGTVAAPLTALGVIGFASGQTVSNASSLQGPMNLRAATTAGGPSSKFFLPGEGGASNPNNTTYPNLAFPYFPPTTYATFAGNPAAVPYSELLNHPILFNPFNPAGTNRVFRAFETEALLRYQDSGSPALGSQLFKLFPSSLNDGTGHNRRLLTTLGNVDIGVPGPLPFLPAPVAGTAFNNYQMAPSIGCPYPIAGNLYPAPPQPLVLPPAPTGGEFNNGMLSYNQTLLQRLSQGQNYLGRINLNRPLSPYPVPNKLTGVYTAVDMPFYQQAVSDRHKLAQDIFNVFLQVTMGIPTGPNNLPVVPSAAVPPVAPASGDPSYLAMQWLAQLAVNMVDYIDSDTNITHFHWNRFNVAVGAGQFATVAGTKHQDFVYGTEIPQLVINEVYGQVDNTKNDIMNMMVGPGSTYHVHLWVELFNPLAVNTTFGDGTSGNVQLENPGAPAGQPIYRLVVNQAPAPTFAAPTQGFQDAMLGKPISGSIPYELGVNNYALNSASSLTVAPQTYFMLGAKSFYGIAPNLKTPFPPPAAGTKGGNYGLAYPIALSTNLANYTHNFYLQRLACPALAYQPFPNQPNKGPYNPYVTVDLVTNIPVSDNRLYTPTGAVMPPPDPTTFSTSGRLQPYGAAGQDAKVPQIVLQTASPAKQPHNTFGLQNVPSANPSNWLVHLDRQVTSAMELMYVSGYAPHRLTQNFWGAPSPYAAHHGHMSMPAWFDTNARIYRALEFFTTPFGQDQTGQYFPATTPTGMLVPAKDVYGQNRLFSGRVPGLMNINDIWDLKTFRALCDAQATLANPTLGTFTQAQVDQAFQKMIQSRLNSPVPVPVVMPGPNNRPFKGMAAGSIDDTLLRSMPAGQGSPRPVNGDPYPPAASGNPPRLFGLQPLQPPNALNKATEHPYVKMDLLNKIYGNVTCRSNVFAMWLTVGFFDVTDGPLTYNINQPITLVNAIRPPAASPFTIKAGGGVASATVQSLSGSILGVPWQIRPGCCVYVGSEPVIVTSVTASSPPSFTAVFQQAHANGEIISMKGVLGKEVGITEGRNTRHRMFALIDRSALSIPSQLSNQNVPATTNGPLAVQSLPAIAALPWANPVPPYWVNPVPPTPIGTPPPNRVGNSFTFNFTIPSIPANASVAGPVLFVNSAAGFSSATAMVKGGALNVSLSTGAGTLSYAGNSAFTVTVYDASTPPVPLAQYYYYIPVYAVVPLTALQGTSNVTAPVLNVNYPWLIQPGMNLSIDGETIAVQTVDPATNNIAALFQNTHNQKMPVPLLLPGQYGIVPGTILGNPGPQLRFDHRLNTALVPHYSIIR